MSAEWFAKKLGTTPAVRPPSVPALAPVQPVAQPVPTPAPQAPLHAAQTATQGLITGKENYQALTAQIEQETGEYPTLLKMSRKWKGGEALRREGHLTCPSCGSLNIFTRANASSVLNEKTGTIATPKPRCFDCGYQEGFTPGAESNWAS